MEWPLRRSGADASMLKIKTGYVSALVKDKLKTRSEATLDVDVRTKELLQHF
jgi:hypothetical protein